MSVKHSDLAQYNSDEYTMMSENGVKLVEEWDW